MTGRKKTYVFDYLGAHCGMHYYDESFAQLLSSIPGHDVEVLSNFHFSERRHRFCPNMFGHGRISGAIVLLLTAARLLAKRIANPSARFIFLTYGNLYEMAFLPSLLLFRRRNVLDVHEAVAQKDEERGISNGYFGFLYHRCIQNVIIHSDRTRSYMERFGYEGQTLFVPHFKYRLRKTYDVSKVGNDIMEAMGNGGITVLFFGNITHEKGVDILLEAYTTLPEAYSQRINVIVAGKDKDGSVYRIDTRKYANVHIIARHINDDELVKLYSESTYVALPYRKTSQSGIMEMAFYFRRKVIASSVPYFVATLQELPSFGLIAEDGVEGFAKALIQSSEENGKYEFSNKDLDRYEMREEMEAFGRNYQSLILDASDSELEESSSWEIASERLFCLLRAAIHGVIDKTELFEGMDDKAWNRVYRMSVSQGVIALAYDGMKKLDEPLQPIIDIRVQWGFNVTHIEKISRNQIATAEEVSSMLGKESVRVMIMKGLTHSSRYPNPLHRQCGDIDVYLMGDFEKGDRIASDHGYEVIHDFFVHSEFRVNGINIENHNVFVNNTVNRTGAMVQAYLAGNTEEAYVHPIVSGALAPSADFEAIFLTRHAIWHFARECIRFRDIVDWSLFLQDAWQKMDSQKIHGLMRETGMNRFAQILTSICRDKLGLKADIRFDEDQPLLQNRVLEDILSYNNPFRHYHSGVIHTFYRKLTSRFERKWCYDMVVPDSFYGNILSSVRDYIKYPWKILTSKV